MFILRLFLSALILLSISNFKIGITVDSLYIGIIVAVILSLLNVFIKPLLFILTLPLNILTLGLFGFVINAALFYFVASFVSGFHIASFWAALLGSFIFSFANAAIRKFL